MAKTKTVVTVISRISDRPAGKEACLVVIYGLDLGKKFDVDRASIVIGRSSKVDIQIDQEAVSRNHCKIINTGSVLSDRADILQGPYSASKHAVKGFTDALRVEIQEFGKLHRSRTLTKADRASHASRDWEGA